MCHFRLAVKLRNPCHLAVSNAESNQKCQRPPAFSGSPPSGGTIMVASCNVGWVFGGKRCPACTTSQFRSPLDFDHGGGGGGGQQILRTLGGWGGGVNVSAETDHYFHWRLWGRCRTVRARCAHGARTVRARFKDGCPTCTPLNGPHKNTPRVLISAPCSPYWHTRILQFLV